MSANNPRQQLAAPREVNARDAVTALGERARDLTKALHDLDRGVRQTFTSFWLDTNALFRRAMAKTDTQAAEIQGLEDRIRTSEMRRDNQQREILQQQREIARLEAALAEANRSRPATPIVNRGQYVNAGAGLSSPFRGAPAVEPGTSPARMIARDNHHAAMDIEAASYEAQLSKTVRAIYDLPPQWARNYLLGQRVRVTNGGCWESDNAQGDKGYVKFNIGSTTKPGVQVSFNNSVPGIGNVNPYAHQLAAVAAGCGQMIMNTVTNAASYQVSHLCHNGSCFNPDHLVVESAALNKARNVCQGQVMTICNCGLIYNSCCHGSVEMMKKCLLPSARVQCGHSYMNVPGNNYRDLVANLRDLGPSAK